VIIFSYGTELKAVKVLKLSQQRGSAVSALELYEDLSEACFLNTNKKIVHASKQFISN
jgi:hypothetical protein